MSQNIGILDYGIAGNIFSIKKCIEELGANPIILNTPKDYKNVDKVVIPGVGSFYDAMQEIENGNNKELLIETILNKPTLGICLGMHILSTLGYEYGETEGLGLINATVTKIQTDYLLPHVGFNSVKIVHDCELFKNIKNESDFYFMHSYEVLNNSNVVSTTQYKNNTIISAIQKDNIFGVQFHPEKSRQNGLKIFQNFIEY